MALRSGFIFIALILSGCGYKFGSSGIFSNHQTVCVPYAEGDLDGSFTNELIKQIASQAVFEYQLTGANLALKVKLEDMKNDNIGYRYYRNKQNKLTRETIPVETRLSQTAIVSLIDTYSGLVVLGPVKITASTDFDHDYYSTKDAINVFSLGQLTDYDEALDAAKKPLYYNLSKKIVDFLADGW